MSQKYYTKNDLQSALQVSPATVNNWIKTGIIPAPVKNGFSAKDFRDILTRFSSSHSVKLRGRANRSLISRNDVSYLGITDAEQKNMLLQAIELHKNASFTIEESVFSVSVALLKSAGLLGKDWLTFPQTAIENFLQLWARKKKINIPKAVALFKDFFLPFSEDDFLGAFYQSLQSISSKSKIGSYYTPAALLKDIKILPGKTVLDPCCGSGGILLKILRKDHPAEQVFAWDIDETALKICWVNLCLFFNDPNICPHIEKRDSVFLPSKRLRTTRRFDHIITNPPWGSKFGNTEKKLLFSLYPSLKTSESFSIVLFNCLELLAEGGTLTFFLPYSFLNVSTHRNLRKYLAGQKKSLKITLLGNVFPGVMSEAIKLDLLNSSRAEFIEILSSASPPAKIAYDSLKEPDYIIPATASGNDLFLIDKIYRKKHLLLKNNALFGMGIVTGNNRKHLLPEPCAGSEPIYRGQDILPFRFQPPLFHLKFEPSVYQQVAPLQLYRQPKIVYRFISDKLICALDRESRLLLNSANLFIPTLDYPPETIVALFNSRLYTYLYRKMFYAKKVLRSHLERLPLPVLSRAEHTQLKSLYDKLAAAENCFRDLDNFVYTLFDLQPEEVLTVENST